MAKIYVYIGTPSHPIKYEGNFQTPDTLRQFLARLFSWFHRRDWVQDLSEEQSHKRFFERLSELIGQKRLEEDPEGEFPYSTELYRATRTSLTAPESKPFTTCVYRSSSSVFEWGEDEGVILEVETSKPSTPYSLTYRVFEDLKKTGIQY